MDVVPASPWQPWLDEPRGGVAVNGKLYKVSGGLAKRFHDGSLDPAVVYDKTRAGKPPAGVLEAGKVKVKKNQQPEDVEAIMARAEAAASSSPATAVGLHEPLLDLVEDGREDLLGGLGRLPRQDVEHGVEGAGLNGQAAHLEGPLDPPPALGRVGGSSSSGVHHGWGWLCWPGI